MTTNADAPFALRGDAVGPVTGPGVTAQAERSPIDEEYEHWRDRSRLVISPVSAPSVLGLFGFSGATLVVAGNLAGWYGSSASFPYYAAFALTFGGVAQFLAGMWSYKARDTLATAMHGMWGSFWVAWGLLWLLGGTKALAIPAHGTYFPGLGMWFVMLAILTAIGALAATAKNISLFCTLGLLAVGSGWVAAALLSGGTWALHVGGWVLVVCVGFAIYTATAILLADTYGRTVLPLGKFKMAANVPMREVARPIEYPYGMPGSRVGQ